MVVGCSISLPAGGIAKVLLLVIVSNDLFSTYRFTCGSTGGGGTFDPCVLTSQFTACAPFFGLGCFTLTTGRRRELLSVTGAIPCFRLSIESANVSACILVIKRSMHISGVSLCKCAHSAAPRIRTREGRVGLFGRTVDNTPCATLSIPLSLATSSILDRSVRGCPSGVVGVTGRTKFRAF